MSGYGRSRLTCLTGRSVALFLLMGLVASLSWGADAMAGGSRSAADQHVAIVKSVRGSVTVLRRGNSLTAMAGMHLFRSDQIRSGADSSAGIMFIDGTRVTVGAQSQIEIRDYLFRPDLARYRFFLQIKKGEAIYSSGRLGKLAPEKVQLKTPRATVGVRGTRFIVKVD